MCCLNTHSDRSASPLSEVMRYVGAAGRRLFLVCDLSLLRNIKQNRHKWCVWVGGWMKARSYDVALLSSLCHLSHAVNSCYIFMCKRDTRYSSFGFCLFISAFSLSLKTPVWSGTEQLLERSDQLLHAALFSPRGLKLKFRLDAARCVHHMDMSLFYFFPLFIYTCCPKSS